MYVSSVEALKKNLDAFAVASLPQQKQQTNYPASTITMEKTSQSLQKAGERLYRRIVEEQIELHRFFGKRWAQYLSLPADISRCRSAADIAQLQLSFLTRMAADYGAEGRHVAQRFQALVSEAVAGSPMPLTGKPASNS